jgi:hypothetical protein
MDTEEPQLLTQKKRGRKPKQPLTTINNQIDTGQIITDQITISEPPEIKKRGRKPTCKVLTKTDINSIKKDTLDECLIIQLPLSKLDIEKITNNTYEQEQLQDVQETKSKTKNISLDFSEKEILYEDNEKIKYNTVDRCYNCEKMSQELKKLETKYSVNKINNLDKQIHNIKINLENIYSNEDLWENTENSHDICCWWCSHTFKTLPIGLPEKYYEKKYYVTGNFCSFNCALAYNLSLNDNKTWDRISLLYHLRNSIFNNLYQNNTESSKTAYDIKILDDIISAPPRCMLKMYGGKLTIEEFRNKSIILKSQYRYIIPPIISLSQPIEESTYNQDQNLLIKPLKMKTFANAKSNELVLKRSKPVSNNKSSLLNMMNIIYPEQSI